jgi:NADH-quinone oxidoreductase subunit G
VEPSTKKVNVTINGKGIEVNAGTSVIEAAEQAGVLVPRYCYHIDLSIAGVCRMCVVEVEKNPKLQIACNTVATEGMIVRTDSPRVKEAVKSALELHLINHPLDCPICDKAGECKLQDFYSQFGLYESRMEMEAKVHKPKVQDIGTIVLDSERCILCTRCVRFTAEVTKTSELGIFNRGDRSELRTYDHGKLRNDYTGNLADICPVGALTAKDFRFQQRVWFLDKTTSICTQCSHGCNTLVSVNPHTKKLYRVEPRRNPEVNHSWICDTGRWDYHYVSDESRIKNPKQRVDGVWVDSTWEFAFQDLHQLITADAGRVLVGLSTQLTNEELVDAVTTLKEMGDVKFTWLVDEAVVDEKQPYDKLLRHHDLTPNAAGFQIVMDRLGAKWMKHKEAIQLLEKGSFDGFVVLGLEGKSQPWLAKLFGAIPKTTQLFGHSSNELSILEAAKWLLPNVTAYEKTGTAVNALGRLQKINPALPPQYVSRGTHAVAFGVKRGHDREALPAGRALAIFEEWIVGRFSLKEKKLRGFPSTGLPLNSEVARG